MKKYIFPILFLFSSFGFSQFLGGTLIKDSKPVKRVATTLDTIAIATKRNYIEPAPTFKSQEANTVVGITAGQLDVSLTGGATYNIPITVPAGINGVVPQISLNYNSQGGNGIGGYGWNIGGLSTITKIASTKFHDNIIDPVDFDASDRYAFDGQRLMLKAGTTYGASGTIYETENFSNVKITANGTHPNGVAYGPASFFVEYPDGAIASYATVSPTDWAITYWQNAQGVRINYLYTNTDNVLTISKITYGATYANVAINEINFDYSIARIRPEEVYIGGLLFKNSKILNSINIKGNSIDFKNYILAHNTTSLNYQSLTSITEKCGDNSLTLSPTVFTYSESYESIVYNYSSTTGIPFTNVKLTNSATVPGDYNGDGKMDFLLYPTLSSDPNKNKRITVISNIDGSAPNFGQSITLTEPFIEIFPTKFITYLNKLSAQDGFTVINRGANPLTMIKFNNLYYDPVGIYQQNLKTIDFGLTYLSVKFFNGDFNGDGLTDVVCLSPNGNYFVNLDMRDTVSKYLSPITEDISVATNFRTGDFNGDGKTDLFIYKNQQLKVYSLNSNNQIVEIMSYSDSNIILTTQILVGDLNGDGKTDFTIPNANNSTTWYSYISTGNSYLKTTKTFYNYIHPVTNTSNYIHYILQDYNNDGKSDLLIMKANGIDTTVSGSVSVHCFKNKNNYFEVNAGLNGDYFASSNSQLGIDKWALPIFYNSIQVNRKLELAFIRDSKIHFFQSLKDFNEDKLIRSVTDGNGVIDAITYKPLIEDPDNNESLGNPNVYFPEGNYLENYPNTDIINAPTFQVVKKLERISSNNSGSSNRKQFFSYYGAVSNLEGQGFLGFRGTTRTNWHTGVAPFYMISNVARNDISLRGSNVESYSAVGWWKPTMSLSSFSSFISKNKTTYNTDNISGAVNSPLLTNKVYKLFANKIENADGLLGTSSETKITYDTFNNPLTATNNTKNGSVVEKTTLTTLTYQNTNVAGNTYIIGRPLTKSETSTIYPNLPDQDIFNSSESYIYTNNLLTRLRKRGNGSTQSIFEYNEYDIFGNIIKKTISDGNSGQIAPLSRGVDNATNIDEPISAAAPENPLVPRIVNYVYNPVAPFFGRFLTSSIDLQGLTTTYNYNGSNGTLLSETNPYGLVTSYNYDKWFKKTATTDYLGNVTTIQYFKYSNSSRIIITPPQGGGVYTEETFNVLGLKVRSGSKNIDGNPVFVSYQYDMNDKLITTSEPFIPNGVLPQTNTIVYDLYGRVTSTTDYKNKTTTISYSNLTTTVNDGTLEKVTVKNAMENEVSVTDNPGGTITNKYFANGNLKSTTYDNGGTTTITQDNWGRKKTLTDPSAGLFSYFYNFFGEIITESNPNGSISYAYDNVGKLLTKKVVGTNGDNTITTNTYDEAGSKLLTATTFNDITAGQVTNYTFGYDNFKRPNFSDESGTKAYFQRATQYDTFGRKTNQLYTAINAANSTQTSSKWTCNVYKNGYLHQLKEGLNGTGVVLYQTNSVNAKGQVLTSQIGNGVAIANEYDIYGFPTKMQHDKGVTNIMTLNNTFDNVRGNLITRDNNLFGTGANLWSEDFTNRYDSNDRLLGYKDHTGNYLTQSYNTNGTISSNVVGANTYNSTKPFQATFIPVTNQSPNYNYYSTRAQTIVYNAIKNQ